MRVGKIIKKVIEEKKINQKTISEISGISEPSISKFLACKFLLKEKNLKIIVDYLRLSKDEELEVWKAWSLDRAEPKAAAYFEKLDKENKKLKKILSSIKEL